MANQLIINIFIALLDPYPINFCLNPLLDSGLLQGE